MKKLRLVFDDGNGKEDITLPMEEWISDWWFECNTVPSNDAIIIIAELDCDSVLEDIKSPDEKYVIFNDVAAYLNWDGLYDDFIGSMEVDTSIENDSEDFKEWLKENISQ